MAKKKAKEVKKELEMKEQKPEAIAGRQVTFMVAGMVVVILLVLFVYSVVQESKSFEYAGLTFEKRVDGYYSRIAINKLLGRVTQEGYKSAVSSQDYDFKMKHDPRSLADIPLDAIIEFKRDRVTYVSVDPDLYECGDLYVSLVDIGRLFGAMDINATSRASPNQDFSEKSDIAYVTCTNAQMNTVVIIQKAEENSITQEGNCYTMNIANCDVERVKERFFIGMLANHQGIRIE